MTEQGSTEAQRPATPHAAALTLIGGPARVGKTTLAQRWATTHRTELVHLDHLLSALTAVATGSALDALQRAPSITTRSPSEWLAELRIRDEVLWNATEAYANSTSDALVMEGGLWPDWVARLQRPHAAIFIVDTANDAADRLVDITNNDPQSWIAQRGWPEQKIRQWATYNRFRSEEIAAHAALHGYPVFDIAAGISQAQDDAIHYLTTTTEGPDRGR